MPVRPDVTAGLCSLASTQARCLLGGAGLATLHMGTALHSSVSIIHPVDCCPCSSHTLTLPPANDSPRAAHCVLRFHVHRISQTLWLPVCMCTSQATHSSAEVRHPGCPCSCKRRRTRRPPACMWATSHATWRLPTSRRSLGALARSRWVLLLDGPQVLSWQSWVLHGPTCGMGRWHGSAQRAWCTHAHDHQGYSQLRLHVPAAPKQGPLSAQAAGMSALPLACWTLLMVQASPARGSPQ